MSKSGTIAPELTKSRTIRFTDAQWEFLQTGALETGVREPAIFLRMLLDRAMKAENGSAAPDSTSPSHGA